MGVNLNIKAMPAEIDWPGHAVTPDHGAAPLRLFSAGLPDAAGTHGELDMMVWASGADAAAAQYVAYVVDCEWADREEHLGQIRIVDFGAAPSGAGVMGWDEIATTYLPFADYLPPEPADTRQTSFDI
jgi:hypothetical protein